ncbi:LAETG motif-containing sortase-dependent surface protein [Streptomyces sp. NPDC014773]|uniref:LAETG motif-containing sortase-dependent surface protein n=1 Tax=Streptomyces sp. NPDC014773 TaxID=3364908 RepID=UPI0036F55F9B
MKIRRMLATAVAAAVTTPVVFLSAGTAFADTPKPTAATAAPDASTREALEKAVADARTKVDDLEKQRRAVVAEIDKWHTDPAAIVDPALIEARTAAEKAVEKAETAKAAADAELAAAEGRLENATEEEKAAAQQDVDAAKRAVEDAAGVLATAEAELETARQNAITGFIDFIRRELNPLVKQLEAAEKELAEAEQALADFEERQEETPGEAEEPDEEKPKPGEDDKDGEDGEDGEDDGDEEWQECDEDGLALALAGPASVTAGTSAVFSLTVGNTSGEKLDDVNAYVLAGLVPNSAKAPKELDGEDFGDAEAFVRYTTVEWSSASHPAWTKLRMLELGAIELGELAKGGEADVKLRLTVAADAPAGAGVVSVSGDYDNEDGACGYTEDEDAYFDVVGAAAGTGPSPSPSTPAATSSPAPAPSSNGSVPQGGRGGELAETGSSDVLPRVGAAAGAALVLGAGAVFVARRRKANA